MVTELLKEIDAYLSSTGMSRTAFGEQVLNDGHLYTRIRNGGITLRTAEKVRKFIAVQEDA